jgi:hypothetical protein
LILRGWPQQLALKPMTSSSSSSSSSRSTLMLAAAAAWRAAASCGLALLLVLLAGWRARWCRQWQHTSAEQQAAAPLLQLRLALLLLLQLQRSQLLCMSYSQQGTQRLRWRQPLHPPLLQLQQLPCSPLAARQRLLACRQRCSSKPCMQALLLQLLLIMHSPL